MSSASAHVVTTGDDHEPAETKRRSPRTSGTDQVSGALERAELSEDAS